MELLGETAKVYSGRHDGMAVIIPVLFYRDGGPYLDREGADYSDNWKCVAAPVVCGGTDRREWPWWLAAGHRASA